LGRGEGAEVFVDARTLAVWAVPLGGGAAHEQLKFVSTIATGVFVDGHVDPSFGTMTTKITAMISAMHFIVKRFS
jgi:hypothetical protein